MLNASELDDLIHLRMSEQQTKALLLELTPENLTADFFSSVVDAMLQTGVNLPFQLHAEVIDCCGTGGSGQPHYNTSTTVAFILASAGLHVAKFGNRAMSSRSGSFDFLDALGFPIELPMEIIPDLLTETRLVFLYAPQFYPKLGAFNTLRRTLGVKTLFNFVGPLLNPVFPQFRLLGVSDPKMQEIVAEFLARDGSVKSALVVRGRDNLDEVSATTETRFLHVKQEQVNATHYHPPDWHSCGQSQDPTYAVGDNLEIFRRLITGEDTQSEAYQLVCLNAGAALWTAGAVNDIEAGHQLTAELLAQKHVFEWVEHCRRAYGQLVG